MSTVRFSQEVAKKRRFLEYFRSEAGRKNLMIASGLAGTGLACLIWVPQCQMVDKLKNTLQMYKDGYPVKLTPYVIDLAAQVLADCKVSEDDAKSIKWFTAFGFDPIQKGQLGLVKGCIVGIPRTFAYNTPDDVDRQLIKMHRDTSIPWKTDAGTALLTSLVFSDAAKKSAIAREVLHCRTSHLTVKAVSVGALLPLTTMLVAQFNQRYSMYRYSGRVRAVWYAVWGVVWVGTAVLAWDSIHKMYEHSADVGVAKMGEEYIKGAIEYCSKRLLANRALREMLGKEGEKSYTSRGDVVHPLWQPRLPLTERKAFFERKLSELRSVKKQDEEEEDEEEEEEEEDEDHVSESSDRIALP